MRRRLPLLFGFVALGLGACSLAGDVTPPPGLEAAQPQPAATGPALIAPRHAPDLAAGEAIFAEKCEPCHGNRGLGDGPQASGLPNPPAALAHPSVARAAVPDEWYSLVTRGRLDRFMPGFTSLTDDERWSVVGYALSLGLDSAPLADGARLFAASCAGCHGANGRGEEAGRDLTHPEFQASTSEQMILEVVSRGITPDMPGFEATLTVEERWAVADYVRQLGLPVGSPAAEATVTSGAPAETPTTPEATATAGETALPTGEGTDVASGSVTGSVVNGTPGGAAPGSMEVTLHGLDGDAEALTQTQSAKPDGSFAFDVPELTPGRLYVATVDYQGSVYSSEMIHLTADTPQASLPITVYETTSDTSSVQIDRLHLLVSAPADGVLQIVELWILSNNGDRAVIPGESGSGLEGTFPEGASQVSFDEPTPGERFHATDGGFTDARPLPPGADTGEWVFSYVLPFARRLDLDRASVYPIGSIIVLVPEGMEVAAPGLVDNGSRSVQGETLHTYSLGPVDPGSGFSLRLSGRPAGSATGTPAAEWIVAVAVLGVALVGAGLLWFRPRLARSRRVDEDADGLLMALAALDRDFEGGRIVEDDYRRQREALKRRAMDTLRRADD